MERNAVTVANSCFTILAEKQMRTVIKSFIVMMKPYYQDRSWEPKIEVYKIMGVGAC